MAIRNIVEEHVPCPSCGTLYKYGFELDIGEFVRARLKISSKLPWKEKMPLGQWTTVGVGGSCSSCGKTLDAICTFNGLCLIDVKPIICHSFIKQHPHPVPDTPHKVFP